MPRVVISYRRSDSAAIAGRIADQLKTRFGEDSVFMDIDNIPLGVDYRVHIRGELLKSEILIVVIGPRWLAPDLTAPQCQGRRGRPDPGYGRYRRSADRRRQSLGSQSKDFPRSLPPSFPPRDRRQPIAFCRKSLAACRISVPDPPPPTTLWSPFPRARLESPSALVVLPKTARRRGPGAPQAGAVIRAGYRAAASSTRPPACLRGALTTAA